MSRLAEALANRYLPAYAISWAECSGCLSLVSDRSISRSRLYLVSFPLVLTPTIVATLGSAGFSGIFIHTLSPSWNLLKCPISTARTAHRSAVGCIILYITSCTNMSKPGMRQASHCEEQVPLELEVKAQCQYDCK